MEEATVPCGEEAAVTFVVNWIDEWSCLVVFNC